MSEKKSGLHIRYADDVEDRPQNRQSLNRAASNSSMSIHSIQSRVAAPGTVLPIAYRTVSYNIEEKNRGHDSKNTSKEEGKRIRELSELDWHVVSEGMLLSRLSTSVTQGLSVEQAHRRISEHGKNKPTRPRTEWFRKLMGYFFGGFGVLLSLGSILVFIAWRPLGNPPAIANLALAIVLLAVFFIQAGFNAWQDWSSARVMASIMTMLPDDCLVVRDGKATTIPATELVPGDIVKIKQGNKLPADVRFIEVTPDAKFDRSILTGESAPVPGSVESTDNNYLETNCIGLQGTHCVSGTVTGIVVATGDKTVFGRIAGLSNIPRHEFTPIQKEVFRFVLIIVSFIATVVIVVIILWSAWLRRDHPNWIDVPLLIVNCVSVGIAFVPEGLPVAVSTSLTIGANIMKKNKILCKSLATVETLGAVTVICCDKTGTLTKNEMFVTDCFAGSKEYKVDDIKAAFHEKEGKGLPSNAAIKSLHITGALCNVADFDYSTTKLPVSAIKMHGDPTDQAILRFSEFLDSVLDLRKEWKKDFEIAFNSRNKFMIRIMSSGIGADCQTTLMIKGAPDILIRRCSHVLRRDNTVGPMSDADRSQIETIKDKWSTEGKRVILIAQKVISPQTLTTLKSTNADKAVMSLAKTELTFVGLWGLIDPLRDDIPHTVETLHNAGIRIMMVTGDFKLTAQAIAIEASIIQSPSALVHGIENLKRDFEKSDPAVNEEYRSIVISGPELITMNDKQWDQLCMYEEIVFARTTPEQKLRIVKEFQARENTVAMTGDGVNDAPALKAADVGVALGSGSDIAIEAADMVLLDAFSAIVEAVKYGRLTFDNLKKTIIYLLPAGSFSEFWPVMANVALGVPQVLSSFLMVIICLFTDAAGAITLAYEKPEMDLLLRPPRNAKTDRLVNTRFIMHAYGFIGIYECLLSFVMAFWYMDRRGIPFSAMALKFGDMDPQYDPDYVQAMVNKASSIYFVNLVITQFFNLITTRTRRLSILQQPPFFNKDTQNPSIIIGMIFSLGIVFIFCYIPGIQNTVDTTTVPVEHFFLPIAFGLGLLMLDEARKYCIRRWPKGILARLAW